ncbi:MAG: DUF6804 family protein [Bacteroidota bacterium]
MKIMVIVKAIQIILFKIALTEGMRVLYYIHQRRISFALFLIIAFIAGRQNKYLSCALAILGMLIFNPFYKAKFAGETWDKVEWILIPILMVWIFFDLYYHVVVPKKGMGILNATKLNKKLGKYEITDASVIYHIDPSLYKNLKKYMRKSHIGSMHSWFIELNQEERLKVKRTPKYGQPLEDE